MLRCSEWWIKEQARNRRIPFSWIGGSYLFTEEHIAEIVRLFEARPSLDSASPAGLPVNSKADPKGGPPRIRLKARQPRRALNGQRSSDAA